MFYNVYTSDNTNIYICLYLDNIISGISRMAFSSLFSSLEDLLISKAGLYNFYHDAIRRAVENKFLTYKEIRCKYYLQLAQYFEDQNTLRNRLVAIEVGEKRGYNRIVLHHSSDYCTTTLERISQVYLYIYIYISISSLFILLICLSSICPVLYSYIF